VAPLDILVVGDGDGKRFQVIETNGTGIGGLTNLPCFAIETVLAELTEIARSLAEPSPSCSSPPRDWSPATTRATTT
jgi:hypothetical protein